jgi:helicase
VLSGTPKLCTHSSQIIWADIRKFLPAGVLTYRLLEALRGADEVRQSGKLPVYRLLDHVTRRVIDYASGLGKPQHPTLHGRIEGEFTWPVLNPGVLYRAAFPDRVRPEVTPDIQSLAAYDFPQGLLDAWAGSIPSLNRLQLDALNDFGLLEGQHLVVSAPTSSESVTQDRVSSR